MSSNAVLAPDVLSTVEEGAHRTTALLEGTAHEIADAARAAHDALVAAAVEPLHRLADSAHALAQAETQLAHEADEARTRILEHVQSDAVDAAGHTARSALEGHIPVAKQLIAPAEHAAEEVKEHLRAAEGELVQNLQSLLVHEVQATQHVVSGMAHEVESSAHTLEAALLQAAEGGLGSVEEHHKARAGEVVAAGEPVLTVVGERAIEVVAYATEEQSVSVAVGDPVRLRRSARGSAPIDAVVTSVGAAMSALPLRVEPFAQTPMWGQAIRIRLPEGSDVKPGESFRLSFR